MYTPDFKVLYDDYFLPSLKDDFEVIVKEIEQECPSGSFRSEGWDKTMLQKLELLLEAIKEHWNDQIFFYSDIDIVFLKPILDQALQQLGNSDLAIQQSWPRDKICAGFMVMRGNQRTYDLVSRAHDLLKQHVFEDDQTALQNVLPTSSVTWKFLNPDQFPNGRKVLKQETGHYNANATIEVNESSLLFHVTSCIGLENKRQFLEQVQQHFLDVETVPTSRSKQYPLPFSKIVIFSAPRTGSSLVYNLFKFIFEDSSKLLVPHNDFFSERIVLKTHRFDEIETLPTDEPILYVCTFRNPIDAAISNHRITTRKNPNTESFAKELIERHISYFQYIEKLQQSGSDVLLFKYEDFMGGINQFLECIEQTFNIEISELDRNLMIKGYAKENVARCTQHLSSFKESLPFSGFHGKHIADPDYTPSKDFLAWLDFYYKESQSLFNSYGY